MKENKKIPRLLFAAPKSGSGKTMVVCGMIAALKARGKKVAAFKCGPDYIDPMFLRKVLGVASGNLDTYFTEGEITRYLFCQEAQEADIAILEGVMGYYDGLGGQSLSGSTYDVGKATKTPVILIVDGKGASVSLAAVIKGMIEYQKDSNIQGILLNQVSAGYYDRIREVIEKECKVKVLGYLPQLKDLEVPSRHLGLVSPEEITAFGEWADQVAKELEKNIDMEALLKIAASAEEIEENEKAFHIPVLEHKVRLAVARDEAFSFYYQENVEVLEKMGAKLIYFSPLHDKELPQEIDGIILWGGYPEKYAKELEENKEMRNAIFNVCRNGLPCIAECGGFLYLQQTLEGEDGKKYQMAGVLKGEGYRTQKLSRFGYMEAVNEENGIVEKGEKIKGHEFHYWDCTDNGEAFLAKKPLGKNSYRCMINTSNLLAGFPHLYYYSNLSIIKGFLESCERVYVKREAKKHWDRIAKPIDSLGLMEDYVVKLCGMQNTYNPPSIKKRALMILCGDHGVVAEGVTQTDASVTKIVSENFAKGISTVNHIARYTKTDVYVADIGMDTSSYEQDKLVIGEIVNRKIRRGTGNIAKDSAMTVEECERAIQVGISLVEELKKKGYEIIATGEMGIGNTTPSSALIAIFTGEKVKAVTGRGAGLSEEGLEKKYKVVEQVLQRVEKKEIKDPVKILAEAGGLEIAGLVGVFLGGMKYQIPIVIDGVISTAAALTAMKISPKAIEFMLASHVSHEGAAKAALTYMGLPSMIHGEMCLGEGTGALSLLPLLDIAIDIYEKMGSFQDYAIEPYQRFAK